MLRKDTNRQSYRSKAGLALSSKKGEALISKQSLPLAAPVITGYHHRAMPLSIIGTHEACFLWILENFIQLRCDKRIVDEHNVLDFVDRDMLHFPTPWLDIQRIDQTFFARYLPDLKDFVRDCLRSNYYVHLYVDEFFVPHRVPFKQEHTPHDILVSGYDDLTETFEVAGFDEQGLYRQTKISYPQFQAATSQDAHLFHTHNPLLLLRLKTNKHSDFAIANVVRWLTAYLHAEDCCSHTTEAALQDSFAYGLEVYEALCHYLQGGLNQPMSLETRPFQMLLERNQLMQRRLLYLQEHGYLHHAQPLIQAYEELAKNSQTIRNGLIKYQLSGLEKLVQKMQDQLLALQAKERETVKAILRELQ